MKVRYGLLGLFVIVLVLGCSASGDESRDDDTEDESDAGGDADGDTDADSDSDSDSDTDAPTGAGCTAMDILFVIDDSGSMDQEQTNLIQNFPKFIEVLEGYKTSAGTQLKYRVGVTTTGVTRNYKEKTLGLALPMSTSGLDGVLQGQQKCGLQEPWIDGPGVNVSTEFSCIANVGINGSATEMPFAGMQDALVKQSEPGGPNHGFYRRDEGSLLVIVIITDEDDCSIRNGGTMVIPFTGSAACGGPNDIGVYTPQEMRDWLDEHTGGPGRYVVVGIAGIAECSSTFGDADRAKRVHEFIDLCADYGVRGDICAGDLWTSLQTALDVMQVTCDDMPPVR